VPESNDRRPGLVQVFVSLFLVIQRRGKATTRRRTPVVERREETNEYAQGVAMCMWAGRQGEKGEFFTFFLIFSKINSLKKKL
jgi:hypothetical protein